MNKFIQKLGVPSSWQLVDVLGLDPELLQMVPQPAVALLLLFPITDKYEEFQKKQETDIQARGDELVTPEVYFMKQTISNACGTVALIHAIANNTKNIQLESGHLSDFIKSTKDMNPSDKGAELEKDQVIMAAHAEHALEGQTEAPRMEDVVNAHFVALVNVNNTLYELDGRKLFPINHGATSEDNFLVDAARVCKDFMERDPSEVRFTMVALASSSG
jgi:ubiquitin carboxyl-terminal hydrolase L3